jgi:hypothetical protein
MRDREIVGLHQAYLDVYSNLNYNQDIVEVAEYLVAEGYADSYEEAEYIIEDMSDEEFGDLVKESSGMTKSNRKTRDELVRKYGPEFFTNPKSRTRSERKEKPAPTPAPSETEPKTRIKFADMSNSSDQGLRGRRKLNAGMEYDTFDAILEHLVAEGYADTNESALAIMANMSDEWRQSILTEDPVQDYRDMKRADENRGGARGPELSHNTTPGLKGKPQPGRGSVTQKPTVRGREFTNPPS